MKTTVSPSNPVNDLLDIADAQPLTEQDQPMVSEIYEVLKKYGAEKRFGLSLLHKHFDISDDEVLIESVNVETRTQTVRPYKNHEMQGYQFVETAWRLDTGKAVMNCKCIKFGNAHEHHERG